MNVVFLSGGSGKRLWPVSSDVMPKQFVKLLKDKQGNYESMVQRVIRQLSSVQFDANVFVACNVNQTDIIKSQLGSVEIIAEPSRRDTFPAIALAAAYLHYKKNISLDAAYIVCPIDVFADKKYFELLKEVEGLLASGKNEIGLMGAIPSIPTEKYGYILQKDGQVSGFVEKPCIEEAEKLISDGALWNCGVFSIKIGYILQIARKYVKFDSYESLYEQYSELPQISFDYEVVEKEQSIGGVVYNGLWKDLGTWDALTEEIKENSMGSDVIISEKCQNTHVLNMLNIPIIAHGLNDIVVVASEDGILVCNKHESSSLKLIAERLKT
jgi:mannose-1-phosphate guanylyltransferase